MIAFCDKIADTINKAIKQPDPDGIILNSGPIASDLDPVGGWFVSPKKTISVTDYNGKQYTITVEEV
jgi:hypothetical protein|tara:strand:- start:440 stop:640 length:201 start_codon:yes stop_codon:yes gene_type:complete